MSCMGNVCQLHANCVGGVNQLFGICIRPAVDCGVQTPTSAEQAELEAVLPTNSHGMAKCVVTMSLHVSSGTLGPCSSTRCGSSLCSRGLRSKLVALTMGLVPTQLPKWWGWEVLVSRTNRLDLIQLRVAAPGGEGG